MDERSGWRDADRLRSTFAGDRPTMTAMLARIGGYSVVVGFVIGLVSGFLLLAAAGFDFVSFFHPEQLLDGGPEVAALLRWGALTDMLGYYLLFVPFFVAVGVDLRRRAGALGDLLTVSGLLYAAIGAVAASVLAIAGSDLVGLYHSSTGATREAAAVGFRTVADVVYFAAWQTLEVIPLGAWAIGSGLLLRRARPVLGATGIALGAVCWLSSVLTMVGLNPSLGAWLLPVAAAFASLYWVYALWLAVLLIRQEEV
jgi:hypothetical protein